jgi:D-alanyl-D-alanine carboxypeptidase
MVAVLPEVPGYVLRRMPRVEEALDVVCVGLDVFGREFFLEPAAARAWRRMQEAAGECGVEIVAVSGFRSVERQREIVLAKLARGVSLEEVLRFSAYPGFSEHHSGRAVDVGTPGCRHLEAEFEDTVAFAWLMQHAHEFEFSLSYPRGNVHGVSFEPWHWCFRREDLLGEMWDGLRLQNLG